MRRLLALGLSLAAMGAGWAQSGGCNCFPPEVQAQTAREALQKARVALYGRVVAVESGGRARLLVLESFKGAAKDTVVPLLPATPACLTTSLAVGDERLLLTFDDAAGACDTHPPEHYLLAAFRALNASAR